MKRLINKLKVHYYTAILMKTYLRYDKIRNEYSCGVALAEYMSPRLRAAKESVNKVIRKIKAIDPEAKLTEL